MAWKGYFLAIFLQNRDVPKEPLSSQSCFQGSQNSQANFIPQGAAAPPAANAFSTPRTKQPSEYPIPFPGFPRQQLQLQPPQEQQLQTPAKKPSQNSQSQLHSPERDFSEFHVSAV